MKDKNASGDLLCLILSLSLIVRDKVKAQSAKHQLSMIHLWTLRFVAENKNPTMQSIAKFLDISAPSATSFVESLIKGGYMARRADKNDRRIVRIELSPEGNKLYQRIIGEVKAKLQTMVDDLNKEEKEGLRLALSALTKISKT